MAPKPQQKAVQQKPNAAVRRTANQIGRAIYRLRKSSPTHKRIFLQTGNSPVFASVSAKHRALAKIFAYELVYPCTSSEPDWVKDLRRVTKYGRVKSSSFEYIQRSFGNAEWSRATNALIEYRKWKKFHKTWNAIQYAVKHSRLEVGPGNTLLVVPTSEAAPKIAGVYSKLGTNAAKKVLRLGVSGLSSDAADFATRLAAVANAVEGLVAVYKDAQTNRLAGLSDKDPAVVKYKTHYYVALLAQGPQFYRVFDDYRTYDRLYHLVLEYVDLERQLDGRTINQRYGTVDVVKPGIMRQGSKQPVYSASNRPYADAAL